MEVKSESHAAVRTSLVALNCPDFGLRIIHSASELVSETDDPCIIASAAYIKCPKSNTPKNSNEASRMVSALVHR